MKLRVKNIDKPKLRTRNASDVAGAILISAIHGGASNTIYNPVFGQLIGGES